MIHPVSIERQLNRGHCFLNLPLGIIQEMPKEQLINMLYEAYEALKKLSRGA